MTQIIYDGTTIPPWADPDQQGPGSNRVPALRYQRLAEKSPISESTKTNLARNNPVPRAYGLVRSGGLIIVSGTYTLSRVFGQIGVALCDGEIDKIQDIYLNNMTRAQWEDAGFTWPGAYNPLNVSPESHNINGIEAFYGTSGQGVPFTFTRGGGSPSLFSFGDYTDTNNGLAYFCLSYDSQDELTALPEVTAVYRGKKVYDPRTDDTRWSPTFALFALDLIREFSSKPANLDSFSDSAEFGEFNVQTSMQATQPELDEINGNVRKIGGGRITDASQTWRQWVDIFADYAGCLLIERANEWVMKPIRSESPVYFFNRSNIKGPVSVNSPSTADQPNRVRVRYTQIVDDQAWTDETAETPEVAIDQRIEEIPLPWYLRQGQADRAAIERLKKIQDTGKEYRFTAFDEALELERGDVINIDDGHKLLGVDAQITSIISTEIGRYDITALEYAQDIPSTAIKSDPGYADPGAVPNLPNDFDVFTASPGFFDFGFWKALENGDIGPAMILRATQFGTPYDIDEYRIQYEILAFDGSLTVPGERIYLSQPVTENVHETEVLQTGDPFGSTIAVFLRGRLIQNGAAPGPWSGTQFISIGTTIGLRPRAPITNTQIGDVSKISWGDAIPNSSDISYEVRYYPGGVVDGFPGTGVLLGVTTGNTVETSLIPSGASRVVAWQATHVASSTIVGISSASLDTRFTATAATRGQGLVYDSVTERYVPTVVPQAVGKLGNQTIASITHINVTGLSFEASANSGYAFILALSVADLVGNNLYINISVPGGGASYSYGLSNSVTRVTNSEILLGSTSQSIHLVHGIVQTFGTSGTVQIQARAAALFIINPSILGDSSLTFSKLR